MRSVIRRAGEGWGKKWGKNVLHLGYFGGSGLVQAADKLFVLMEEPQGVKVLVNDRARGK